MNPEGAEAMLQALRAGLDAPGPARVISDRQEAQLVTEVMQRSTAGARARKRSWVPWGLVAVPLVTAAAATAYMSAGGGSNAAPPVGVTPNEPMMPSSVVFVAQPTVIAEQEPTAREFADAAETRNVQPEAAALRTTVSRSTTSSAPEDLLLDANRLRRQGEWQKSEAKYLEVTRLQPGTLSAYVAMASVGSLRLTRNPNSALRIYQRARLQRPTGPLDAEIRWGIASAHRALGNSSAERRELEALLRAHPSAATAERARSRLAALEP